MERDSLGAGLSAQLSRLRLIRTRAGARAVLGAVLRRCLRPLVSWHSVSFFERDLTKGPVPDVRAGIPLEVRLVETDADVRPLQELFARIGRKPADVKARLDRGERCFIGLSGGRIVHFSWIGPGPASCPEIKATVRVGPGELYQGDSYTDEAARGHRVTGAVMSVLIDWERARGYRRHVFYIARDNHSSLGSFRKVPEPRPLLTRTVRCYRVAGLGGFLVIGLGQDARPRLDVAENMCARRLGRLGHWVSRRPGDPPETPDRDPWSEAPWR